MGVNLDEYLKHWRESISRTRSFQGYGDKYIDEMTAKYRRFLEQKAPLFKADYLAMPKEEQAKYGRIVWQGNFPSTAGVNQFLTRLYAEQKAQARQAAINARKAYVVPSGKYQGRTWSGKDFLVAPNGTRKIEIGFTYPWFTRPDEPAAITDDRLMQFRM